MQSLPLSRMARWSIEAPLSNQMQLNFYKQWSLTSSGECLTCFIVSMFLNAVWYLFPSLGVVEIISFTTFKPSAFFDDLKLIWTAFSLRSFCNYVKTSFRLSYLRLNSTIIWAGYKLFSATDDFNLKTFQLFSWLLSIFLTISNKMRNPFIQFEKHNTISFRVLQIFKNSNEQVFSSQA